jgi:predicted acetyltransferase
MRFHYAEEKDTPQIRALWEYSFEDESPFLNWYFREIYSPAQTLCCTEKDKIVSSLQFASYNINLRSAVLKIGFLVAVNILPGLRGRGYGKSLMAEAIKHMAEKHVPVSLLTPLSAAFYRSCGYEYTYNELRWNIPLSTLSKTTASNDGVWRELNLKDDINHLSAVYAEMTHGKNAYILRSPENWSYIIKSALKEGAKAYLLIEDESARAYVVYYLNKVKREMTIREIGYTDSNARREVFAFISGHRNQIKTLRWNSMPAEMAFLSLAEEHPPLLKPVVMARIISLPETLAALSYPLGENTIVMRVIDPQAPWNDGLWKLQTADGRGVFSPAGKDEEAEITLNISALTCVVFGYINPWFLAEEGKIKGEAGALSRLCRMFPPCSNYMGQYI